MRPLPSPAIPIDRLLNKRQVAEKCGISMRTLDDWVKGRKIPCIKIGRVVRFNWPAVEIALRKFERKSI